MRVGARVCWLVVGFTALLCGAAGVVLPLVPTTPFVLLAVYAFARSSPELENWLRTHQQFGPVIRDWDQSGAIRHSTKWVALTVMAMALVGSWLAGVGSLILVIQAIVMTGAALFILSRPDAPTF